MQGTTTLDRNFVTGRSSGVPWTASAAGEELTPERQAELNEKLKVGVSDMENDEIKSLLLQGANPHTRDPENG